MGIGVRELLENNVDEGCYVRYVNFAIGVDIDKLKISGFAVGNHIHQGCHVGHIHLSIEVDAPISVRSPLILVKFFHSLAVWYALRYLGSTCKVPSLGTP